MTRSHVRPQKPRSHLRRRAWAGVANGFGVANGADQQGYVPKANPGPRFELSACEERESEKARFSGEKAGVTSSACRCLVAIQFCATITSVWGWTVFENLS